jgi:predicted nucleotidyltransferase
VYTCAMVTRRQINKLAKLIAEQFRPAKIILFGSYAYGTPTEDSDVDLLVVMPASGAVVDKAIEIYAAMDALGALPHATDLMVRTPAQLQKRLSQKDVFLREIVEKGRVLYERDRAGVGRQSGGRLRRRAAGISSSQSAKL